MARSKRHALQQPGHVSKKGKESKDQLMQKTLSLLSAFPTVMLLALENIRSCHLRELREHLATNFEGAKLLLGKTKIIAKALQQYQGKQPEIAGVGKALQQDTCLLFCGKKSESSADASAEQQEQMLTEVMEYLQSYQPEEFARAGAIAPVTVVLPAGPLRDAESSGSVSHTQEAYLRSLGMPCALKNGTVMLEREWTVCREGERLTADQANVLRALKMKLARAAIKVRGYYHGSCSGNGKSEQGSGKWKMLESSAEGMSVDE